VKYIALLLLLVACTPVGDTTPPSVSLSASPTTVTDYSPLTLTANASDNKGVTRVEFYDGSQKIGEDTTPADGFSLSFRLKSSDNGSKSYTAKAFDAAGNSATSSPVSVSVNITKDTIPPNVSLTSSANPVTKVGDLILTASASDNIGIAKVVFYRGSTQLGEASSAPYTFTTRITRADNNSTLSFKAVASDFEGNTTESALSVSVNIPPDTTPPTVSLSASKTTITVPESVIFTATATDDEGVSRVELYQGTQLLQTKTAAPYTFTVNLSKADNGSKDYSAKAYDPSGNVGTSNTVTLNINILSNWPVQFANGDESIYGVATDSSGNLLVAGSTSGSLQGTNAGKLDAFVRKYDTNGQELWTRQFGTPEDDIAYGVATDGNNLIVVGSTRGALQGSNAGGADYWVRKYDSSGNPLWTVQNGSSGDDIARGIAVDSSGAVALVGSTTGNLFGTNFGQDDLFVVKYSSAGSLLQSDQDGTVDLEQANGVAFDSNGNIYIAALWAGGTGGRSNGALLKYTSGVSQIWRKTFAGSVSSGTQNNTAWNVAVDSSGNPIMVGFTNGLLSGVTSAAGGLIQKYNSDGAVTLTRQIGSTSTQLYSVALDSANNILVAGQLQTNKALVAKLDSAGNPVWSKETTANGDTASANGVATDGSNVFVGGTARGGILSGTVSSKLLAFALSYSSGGTPR